MPERRLIVVNPGHFHAALVQKEMYPGLSERVHVYAPAGPDLDDYADRIARFNARAEAPTRWELVIATGDDFGERLRAEPPGGIVVLSGRNRGKIELIRGAVEAGLHVLADKPMIIRRADLPALAGALDRATERRLVVGDMMGGRHEITATLTRLLHADSEVFGQQLPGSAVEPGVAMTSLHHLRKQVSGRVSPRPPWYFDIAEQGDALADIGTHLVDRVQQTLFPGAALDYDADIAIHDIERWPTPVGAAQFHELTGTPPWPDYLAGGVRHGAIDYDCNVRLHYALRGIHVELDLRWEWQEPPGGSDTHTAIYRGSRARLELRHGPDQRWRPQLYVVPLTGIGPALEHRIHTLRQDYPGLGLELRRGEWRIDIPDALRIGHDAHFAALTGGFLGAVDDPATVPAQERPNLLAKYYTCTAAEAARAA
jgi:predicted dehydrogenase